MRVGTSALGMIALAHTTFATCAQPLSPSTRAEQDENEIVAAVLRQQIKPGDQGVCLESYLRGAPSGYLEWLGKPIELAAGPEQQRYLQDAATLAGNEQISFAEPRTLDLDALRRLVPAAAPVEPSQCNSVVDIMRPIIVGDWAFLSVGRANSCHTFIYRMSAKRSGRTWAVQHSNQTSAQAGPPACGTRPWSPQQEPGHHFIRISE